MARYWKFFIEVSIQLSVYTYNNNEKNDLYIYILHIWEKNAFKYVKTFEKYLKYLNNETLVCGHSAFDETLTYYEEVL